MPVSSSSLVPLIQQWEAYAAECTAAGAEPALAPFAGWLSRQLAVPVLDEPADATDAQYGHVRLADKVGILIWRLSRFMRASFKQHFAASPLQSIDEFSLLAGTHYLAGPTKTQLFQHDLLETTTGLQMLARLQRQGLVAETADPADRRRKRVALTPAGQAVLAQAGKQMDYIADDLFHHLSQADLEQLESLLLRLNHYHTARG
ncbi:MarR family winged helix-turn-helix transcriptional regulator [Hymenobacter sp.]|uniref:MarR family winged helix-turn-helix transcriptional regulator n=1 Tax=Hymenobacter sp. TaxID=1898978 RepID=UPI00286C036A|nr:MarR family winged helix-turn-helix transcriptional regulator [Hymenobacter sp.]